MRPGRSHSASCPSTQGRARRSLHPDRPFYLSWKARQSGFESRFIELAGHVNAHMPHFVADKVVDALNSQRKAVNGARILVLGIAYKRDIDDVRESPALDVMHLLEQKGAVVDYSDPYVPVLPASSWPGDRELRDRGSHRGVAPLLRLCSRRDGPQHVRLRSGGGIGAADRGLAECDQHPREPRVPGGCTVACGR